MLKSMLVFSRLRVALSQDPLNERESWMIWNARSRCRLQITEARTTLSIHEGGGGRQTTHSLLARSVSRRQLCRPSLRPSSKRNCIRTDLSLPNTVRNRLYSSNFPIECEMFAGWSTISRPLVRLYCGYSTKKHTKKHDLDTTCFAAWWRNAEKWLEDPRTQRHGKWKNEDDDSTRVKSCCLSISFPVKLHYITYKQQRPWSRFLDSPSFEREMIFPTQFLAQWRRICHPLGFSKDRYVCRSSR